jgi:hypothetical protein
MSKRKVFRPSSVGFQAGKPSAGPKSLFLYGADGNDLPGAEDGLNIKKMFRDYDVEIILTRKVKPLPVGFLVYNDLLQRLYVKRADGWKTMSIEEHSADGWSACMSWFTDERARKSTVPLFGLKWDEVDERL